MPPLSSFLPGLCWCGKCGHRLYHYGKQYMHCPAAKRSKGGDGDCNAWGTAGREAALAAILDALQGQVLACPSLVDAIIARSVEVDVRDDDGLSERIEALDKAIKRTDALMAQVLNAATGPDGMDKDEEKRYQGFRAEKSRLNAEREGLLSRQNQARDPVTRDEIAGVLANFTTLLTDAGNGELGGVEGRNRALALLDILVGGRIDVFFDHLHGRRKAIGRGRFKPALMEAIRRHGGVATGVELDIPEVEVSFRELPRYARIADEVYRLYDEGRGLTMTEIGKQFGTTSGNAWAAYAYWHEKRGLPTPIKREGFKAKRRKPEA